MWEEEYPLPGYQTQTERHVTAQIVGLGLLSSWMVGGDFLGGPAICAAIGAISLFFYFIYREEAAYTTRSNRRFFKRWLIPPFLVMAIWVTGQFSPTVHEVFIGDRTMITFTDVDNVGPVSGMPFVNYISFLYPMMVMISMVGLVAFTHSQHALAEILRFLTRSVLLLAAIGLIGLIFRWKKILTFLTPAQGDYFSVFPSGEQWAAFALFWMVVSFGVFYHLGKREGLLSQRGFWLTAGWLILALSVYWTGAPVHHFLLGVGIGVLMLSSGVAYILRKKALPVLFGLLLTVAGFALTGASIYYFAQEFTLAQNDPTRAPFGIPWSVQSALWRDAWLLVEQRPLFGWGAGSFTEIFPFHQQVDLGIGFYRTPYSDALLGLVEYGIVGMTLWLIFPAALMIKFACLKTHRRLSHYLWGASTLLAVLALVSQPMTTPANFICIWLGLALAFKWSDAAEQNQPMTPVARTSVFPMPERKTDGATGEHQSLKPRKRHSHRRRSSKHRSKK
ncbi:O-antigen ligase family protein [Cerasicoccus maritimus]|uniref:O-antigen ligase family protein n=1 Tax=Cerasicoccus maritimus TaxID=490089 RepID=UPI002852C7FA|nr:O-antigen ligase family protein [Cerasicoccus maritimus]